MRVGPMWCPSSTLICYANVYWYGFCSSILKKILISRPSIHGRRRPSNEFFCCPVLVLCWISNDESTFWCHLKALFVVHYPLFLARYNGLVSEKVISCQCLVGRCELLYISSLQCSIRRMFNRVFESRKFLYPRYMN